MKKLVLVQSRSMYFFDYVDCNEIDIQDAYRKHNRLIFRMLFKVSCKLKWKNVFKHFLNHYINRIEDYEAVIIFDSVFNPLLVQAIREKSNITDIYLYLWNPVKGNSRLVEKVNASFEAGRIYSFDKNDCNLYNWSFAPMVYSKQVKIVEKTVKYDVAFVGFLKDREEVLSELVKIFKEKNLLFKYYLVADKKYRSTVFTDVKTEYIDYEDYLEYISDSKAILEILQKGQIGLTIRSLETLYFKKKLITNNFDILNYDIYHPNNVFIIGHDDAENLIDFLHRPFILHNSELLEKYDFTTWIGTFGEQR